MSPFGMTFYARMCGWTLARAHARSGDPIAIAEYLGTDDTFDNAIADFSARYADQNQRDYDSLRQSHCRRPNPSRHRDLSLVKCSVCVARSTRSRSPVLGRVMRARSMGCTMA